MWRRTPPECPICGAAHTTCSSGSGPITVVQLPARDAAEPRSDMLVADAVQATLPPGQVTTGTYRGKKAKP